MVHLTEAEDIKKRWQKYTEELYEKDLHDQIITMVVSLTQSQTSWNVKSQGLGSISTNKASGYDGIPVELFQILKDDAVKVLYSICQQIWKTQQWPQDWKWTVFIPTPKERQCQLMLKQPHNCTHLTHQ